MVPTAKSCSLALSGLSRSLQGQAVAATGKTATGKRRWNPHEPIVCQVPILVMPVEYLNSDGSSLFSGDVRMINSMIKNTISMPQFWSGNVKLAPGDVKPWNLRSCNPQILVFLQVWSWSIGSTNISSLLPSLRLFHVVGPTLGNQVGLP